MRLMPALAAALSLSPACTPTLAQDFDDPAVALCEYALTQRLHPDIDYRRRSAMIAGKKVTIFYSVSFLNTAPRLANVACVFKLSDKGFVIDPTPGTDPVPWGRMDADLRGTGIYPIDPTATELKAR